MSLVNVITYLFQYSTLQKETSFMDFHQLEPVYYISPVPRPDQPGPRNLKSIQHRQQILGAKVTGA